MDNSPLIKLPGELRNRIYDLVLHHHSLTFVSFLPRYRVAGPKPSHHELRIETDTRTYLQPRHPLALTHTCREIRNETLGLFFGLNKISFPINLKSRMYESRFNKHSTPLAAASAMHAWLKNLQAEDIAALGEITLDAGKLPDHGVPGLTFADGRSELAIAFRFVHDQLRPVAVSNGLSINVLVVFHLSVKRPRRPQAADLRLALLLLGDAEAMRTAVRQAAPGGIGESVSYCRREAESFVEVLIKELELN